MTVINLTNNVALYNFLSTFSGTHYVTPRALTANWGSTSKGLGKGRKKGGVLTEPPLFLGAGLLTRSDLDL